MYKALYRKYRPTDFDTVVGQNPIVKTLKNSIINNSFTHAYMFYGPRGTGKTTVSKIFARNVNCLNNKDGNACGKCEACEFSFSKECVDIIEIDAASNNGVDEIRELKNKISLVKKQGFVDIALNSFFIGVIILSVILIFCTAFIFTF